MLHCSRRNWTTSCSNCCCSRNWNYSTTMNCCWKTTNWMMSSRNSKSYLRHHRNP
jgi:hypothetical protein